MTINIYNSTGKPLPDNFPVGTKLHVKQKDGLEVTGWLRADIAKEYVQSGMPGYALDLGPKDTDSRYSSHVSNLWNVDQVRVLDLPEPPIPLDKWPNGTVLSRSHNTTHHAYMKTAGRWWRTGTPTPIDWETMVRRHGDQLMVMSPNGPLV